MRDVPLAWPRDPVELVVPLRSRIGHRSGLQLRYTDLHEDERALWSDIPVATPLRMTLDLLLAGNLPDAVADLDAVLRAGLVELDAVEQLVAERSDRGVTQARQAVGLADARAESRPESRVRVWLALAGLHPVPQYWVPDERGRLARVDLAFPEHRLAVEYDGAWHKEAWALNRDRERLNRVQAAGWEVVFVTADLLRDPARMVALVRAALSRRRRTIRDGRNHDIAR